MDKKIWKKVERRVVNGVCQVTQIPLKSLSDFTEEHLHSLVVEHSIRFGSPFLIKKLGLDISDIRKIAKSGNSNDFSSFYIALGMKEQWVRLWNPIGRYDYLVLTGYGRKLILDYAKNLATKDSLSKPIEEVAANLSQSDFSKSPTIKKFMPSKYRYSASILLDFKFVGSAKELSNWPQGFLTQYSESAMEAYFDIKRELGIEGIDWKGKTCKLIEKDTVYGKKMLSQFKNSIHDMVMYFEDVEPINIVKRQGSYADYNVLREIILSSLAGFHDEKGDFRRKKIKDLPSISVTALSKNSRLSSYISAVSRTHRTSHPELMCKIFPEQKWNPFDFFVSGVPDNYWFNTSGELNVEHATSAIESVLERMYGRDQLNDYEKKIEFIGRLTQNDLNQHNLSSLASPSSLNGGGAWGWSQILTACYPEVDISQKIRTRSAIRFVDKLKRDSVISPDVDALSCCEVRSFKTGNKSYLYDDLHLELKINDKFEKVVFELQGPQHYTKKHLWYNDSIVKNDALKFSYHTNKGTRIFYVKTESLASDTYIDDLNIQGFDIKKGIAEHLDVKERATILEGNSFVASGFTALALSNDKQCSLL